MTPAQPAALVDTEWIAAHVGDQDVRVVEVDVSRAAYDEGHIPGAFHWNAYADLRDAEYRPVGPLGFDRLLRSAGVTPETTVVTYGYGAPLGFWLLKAHGHDKVRMLMGSREQWTENGHDWSTAAPENADAARPEAAEDERVLASRHDVEAAIGDATAVLLDVRSEEEFSGERFWPSGATADAGRAGHMPGAVNVPIGLMHADDGTLRSPEDLRAIFQDAGVTADKTVITYCTIGNRASEAWFALSVLLGYPDVRVYYGSWVEWGKAPDAPVE